VDSATRTLSLHDFALSPTRLAPVEAYRIVLATSWLLRLPGNPGHGHKREGSAEIQAVHLLDLLDRAVRADPLAARQRTH
jgi:hypothetical protein